MGALTVPFLSFQPQHVPVETNLATSNLDPARIAAALTPLTLAIMSVHLYGQACEMGAIMERASTHNLHVVEDNAQSQRTAFDGQLTCRFGAVNGTNLYYGKNPGILGNAGAVTTNDAGLDQKGRVLRNHGSQQKYYNEVVGYDSPLDELQAAVLEVKLPYLPEWAHQRQQVAAWYDESLAGIAGLPLTAHGITHVHHLYVVHTPQRDALQQHLTNQGIGSLIHYPAPPHRQQAYTTMQLPAGTFPIAEELAATCLSLPMYPEMSQEQVRSVAPAIQTF